MIKLNLVSPQTVMQFLKPDVKLSKAIAQCSKTRCQITLPVESAEIIIVLFSFLRP